MKTFGQYLRENREKQRLPLIKVAASLDIDTSILNKIERGERDATKDMLSKLSKVLKIEERELQIRFFVYILNKNFGKLKYFKEGLKEIINDNEH